MDAGTAVLLAAVACWVGDLVAAVVVLQRVDRKARETQAALPGIVRDQARDMMAKGELDDAAFAMLTRLSQRGTGAVVIEGLAGRAAHGPDQERGRGREGCEEAPEADPMTEEHDPSALLQKHVIFVATTQVGKTTLMGSHFGEPEAPEYVIFLDGKGDADLPGFHHVNEPRAFDLAALLAAQAVAHHAPDGRAQRDGPGRLRGRHVLDAAPARRGPEEARQGPRAVAAAGRGRGRARRADVGPRAGPGGRLRGQGPGPGHDAARFRT